MTTNDRSIELLRKAAEQFRFYERQHMAKVERWDAMKWSNPAHPGGQRIGDTQEKARVNAALAEELEAHLAFLEEDAA